MKATIFIPDKTKFAENLTKQLNMSHSELEVKALEHYLKLEDDEELAANFNKIYESADQ